ncbi:MAG: type II toxin-antitoxin system VapC family toxin [Anaerolineae bacterium]
MAVIDASVYVALFNTQEAGHAAGRAWLQRALSAQESLSAPVILLAEVAAALSRGVGDIALAHEVVQDLADSGLIQDRCKPPRPASVPRSPSRRPDGGA